MQIAARRAVVTSVLALTAFTVVAVPLRSPTLARVFIETMSEHQLQAFATAAPDGADRFVGALAYPGVQLLVMSARSTNAQEMQRLIAAGQYNDAYVLLNQASIADGRLFVQDMKADGLPIDGNGAVDVVYRGDAERTMLDGEADKQGLSAQEYAEAIDSIDAAYSAALQELIDGLKGRAKTQD